MVRNGGAEGARTPDLRRARAALSQLSYGPSNLEWGVRAYQPCATIQPMTNPETAREKAVNPLLGQLLRARGVPARAERRGRGYLVARQHRAPLSAHERARRLDYQRDG